MATVRAPHLYRSLRCFCLGAFHVLSAEDVDLPFAFEQHESRGRPVLYEYRPLVRDFVEARARKLEGRQDAQLAVQDLRAEPAAGVPDVRRARKVRTPEVPEPSVPTAQTPVAGS